MPSTSAGAARPSAASLRLRLAGLRWRALAWPLAAVALAAAGWLALGPGFLEVDSRWALLWGDQLISGTIPSTAVGPIQHPLATALGIGAALLGPGAAEVALIGVGMLSLSAVALGVGWIGARVWSPAAGVVAAVVVALNFTFLARALGAVPDVTVTAAVLAAVAVEVRWPKRALPVLALLGVAGLQRPEAWALSLAYLVYAGRGRSRRELLVLAAVAGAAPAVWTIGGLLATGDPGDALRRTSSIISNRPETAVGGDASGPVAAVERTWDQLRMTLRLPVLAGGLAGLVLAWLSRSRAARVVAAAAVVWTAPVLALAGAGFPTSERFLLPTSALLALLCAATVAGWTRQEPGRLRTAWIALAVLLAALLLATSPSRVDDVDRAAALADRQSRALDDLEALIADPRVARAVRTCRPVSFPGGGRAVPVLAYRAERPVWWFERDGAPTRARGTLITAASADAARLYKLERAGVPAGMRPLAANASWTAHAGAC